MTTSRSTFLSIPRWREMHLLHGLLMYLIASLIVAEYLLFIVNDPPVIRQVLYLTYLAFSPFAAIAYYLVSSNLHLSKP